MSNYDIYIHTTSTNPTTNQVTLYLRFCDFLDNGSAAIAANTNWNWDYAKLYVQKCFYEPKQIGFYYDIEYPTYLLNDYSTVRSTHGTQVYDYSAPIPSGCCIYVGEGKDFETVQAAYAAATHGDNIVIDPGVYDTGYMDIYKCVRFYGVTGNPNDVVLTSTAHHQHIWHLSSMGNTPLGLRGPGYFHLTLDKSETGVSSWGGIVLPYGEAPAADPTVYIPECVDVPFWTEYDDSFEQEKEYE